MKHSAQEDELPNLLLHFLRQLLQVVAGYESIAVGEENALAIELYALGFTVHLNACLLRQPTESPNIVVTNEEVHGYAFVGDGTERLQERTILLLAPIAPEILTPEVKYISEQVYGRSVLSHAIEHVNQGPLMSLGVVNSPRTQMRVGEEVNHCGV